MSELNIVDVIGRRIDLEPQDMENIWEYAHSTRKRKIHHILF